VNFDPDASQRSSPGVEIVLILPLVLLDLAMAPGCGIMRIAMLFFLFVRHVYGAE
jgi:hypothetical protein